METVRYNIHCVSPPHPSVYSLRNSALNLSYLLPRKDPVNFPYVVSAL